MIISGVEILPGEHKQVSLGIARLPTRTAIDLPVFVFRSKESGPTLLVTAGVHGDEINGIETLRRMLKSGSLIPNKGTIIVIPLLNVFGFINFARGVPDGKDINRSFPGNPKGSMAARIAFHVTNILHLVDYGLDLHTGGAQRSNYPQIRYTEGDEMSKKLAEIFAAPFIISKEAIPKSFRKEGQKRNTPIITYEGGESSRMDELAIKHAEDGVKRVMHYLGMIDKAPEVIQKPIELTESRWIRGKISGLFRSAVSLGDPVVKNQIIGAISDPYGEIEVNVRASSAGSILGLNYFPIINQGDALFHIGKHKK